MVKIDAQLGPAGPRECGNSNAAICGPSLRAHARICRHLTSNEIGRVPLVAQPQKRNISVTDRRPTCAVGGRVTSPRVVLATIALLLLHVVAYSTLCSGVLVQGSCTRDRIAIWSSAHPHTLRAMAGRDSGLWVNRHTHTLTCTGSNGEAPRHAPVTLRPPARHASSPAEI